MNKIMLKPTPLLTLICSLTLVASCSNSPDKIADAQGVQLGCDDRYTTCAQANPQVASNDNATPNSTVTVVDQPQTPTEQMATNIQPNSNQTTELLPKPAMTTALFGFDQYHTQDMDLAKHIQYLRQNPQAIIQLHGYTDPIGTEEYNQALSQKRADFVKQQFIAEGISALQIKTHAHGETHLVKIVTPEQQNLNWEQLVDYLAPNRRVEILY